MAYSTRFGVLFLIATAFGHIFFEEDFEDNSWKERWIPSTYTGTKFGKFETATVVLSDGVKSAGLRTSGYNQHYALSTRFTPVSIANKTLVLQYSVKYAPNPTCEEALIKLYGCDFEPTKLYKESPYVLRFGPQVCGPDGSVSLYAENLWGYSIDGIMKFSPGKYPHVYTLILRHNLSHEFLIDGRRLPSNMFTQSDSPLLQNGSRNADSMYPNICGIGFNFYQHKSGTIFDNILFSDDVDIAKRKREEVLAEMTQLKSGGTVFIVDITTEDLKRILNYNKSIEYNESSNTNTFLEEFDKFLVPFHWDNNNSALMATAEYNRYHSASNVSIQLWVSFQPRKETILDDIDLVLEAVNEANSLAPNTVTTIVISYGFLQLDDQTWPFVNHEIQKVHKRLKSLQVPPKLALQIYDINCQSRREYPKYLEANLLDFLVLMPMPQTKQLIRRDADNIFDSCVKSADLIDIAVAPLIHSYESVEIDFENGVYSYNRNVEIQFISSYTNALTLIRAADKTHKKDNTTDTVQQPKSKNLANWLYQPTGFNKSHFGAVVSWKDNQLMGSDKFASALLESFNHIMIDISDQGDFESENSVEPIVEELVRYSILKKKESGGHHIAKDIAQLQISILVTIKSNEFEENKRQVNRAISAAQKCNAILPWCVTAIYFDLLACSQSEICSGYNKNGVEGETICLLTQTMSNVSEIMHYATKALNIKRELVWLGRVEDKQFQEFKRGYESNKCGERHSLKSYLNSHYLLCKTTLRNQDILNHGGLQASQIAIKGLSFCRYKSKTHTNLVSFYVNVVGCGIGHSNMTFLVEYSILMERLSRWAATDNILLFINAGAEPLKCNEMVSLAGGNGCGCGWWIKQASHDTYQDKKSMARHFYEVAITNNDVKRTTAVATESLLWLWVLIPVVILGVLFIIFAAFLIFHYRSKYILTKQEVAEFIKGRQTTRMEPVREGDEAAETQSYNSEKYELSPLTFTIDKTSGCLGSGEFGQIYSGSIRRDGVIIEAAVKMANTRLVSKSHGYYLALKGLLSEIKILAYVGEHNHIVSLLGAYTRKVRKGEIAVFLELCQLGSLDKYLHTITPQVIDDSVSANIELWDEDACCIHDEENEKRIIQALDEESNNELYRWAGEIAIGMEFLASKKLVHADLATRNILLTAQKVVKISDFGLSRRLYDYTEYVKRSQAPLPWRWMPPESLCRSIFNEKTDVWAYGVTLWEMFTLGDQPYPGLSWTGNFPSLLERGIRLPEPRFNVREVYSVMMRCWDINPSMRPSFTQLKSELDVV